MTNNTNNTEFDFSRIINQSFNVKPPTQLIHYNQDEFKDLLNITGFWLMARLGSIYKMEVLVKEREDEIDDNTVFLIPDRLLIELGHILNGALTVLSSKDITPKGYVVNTITSILNACKGFKTYDALLKDIHATTANLFNCGENDPHKDAKLYALTKLDLIIVYTLLMSYSQIDELTKMAVKECDRKEGEDELGFPIDTRTDPATVDQPE